MIEAGVGASFAPIPGLDNLSFVARRAIKRGNGWPASRRVPESCSSVSAVAAVSRTVTLLCSVMSAMRSMLRAMSLLARLCSCSAVEIRGHRGEHLVGARADPASTSRRGCSS